MTDEYVAWDIGGPEIPAAIRLNTAVLVNGEPDGLNFPDFCATGRSTTPGEGFPRYATVRYNQTQ